MSLDKGSTRKRTHAVDMTHYALGQESNVGHASLRVALFFREVRPPETDWKTLKLASNAMDSLKKTGEVLSGARIVSGDLQDFKEIEVGISAASSRAKADCRPGILS